MSTISIGIVGERHPHELKELSDSLAEIINDKPQQERILGLAGPNEVVQLLIDAVTWKNALYSLALILGGKFAASFATELGKLTATKIWKEKKNYHEAFKKIISSPFHRFVNAIKALRTKNQTILITIKIPGTIRNASLALISDDPAEIAWQIANVIRCAEDIKDIVEAAKKTNPNENFLDRNNPDMSVVIEVLDNGDVKVFDVIIKK